MKKVNQLLFIRLVVALTMTSSSIIAPAQPASAQILELATGAISIINSIAGKSNNSQQQQQQQQQIQQQQQQQQQIQQQQQSATPDFSVGAGNLNGNTINLCISGCAPAPASSR